MTSASAQPAALSAEGGLVEAIQALSSPKNAVHMDEARDNACNMGVLKFACLVKSYKAKDPEIASLSGKLTALFLHPSMAAS
uniref:Protein C10 n=1 Tax=Propithecus coquereli TaxID=379532 RepID=A0A2K6FLK1_PROCO